MSAQAKEKSPFGIDLKNLGRGVGSAKLPNKPIINLAPAEAKRQVQMKYIAIVILALAFLAIGYKYLIVDQQARLTVAQQAVEEARAARDEAQAKLDDFELNDMEGEYYHLTYDGMTPEELEMVDRVEIMDMIERVMDGDTSTPSWLVSDNTLELTIDSITLEEVNQTMQKLWAEDLVLYCTLSTAALYEGGEDEESADMVSANIVAYLALPVEEEALPEGGIVIELPEELMQEVETE